MQTPRQTAVQTARQTPRIIPAARIARAGSLPSARRLAAAVTLGAAAVALVLAAALPARAGAGEDGQGGALGAPVVIGAFPEAVVPEAGLVPAYTKKPRGRVPDFCAIEFEGDRRTVTIYAESCLLDAGLTRKLPYRCGKDARIFGHWDVVFSEKCLREAGFVLPGGHSDH